MQELQALGDAVGTVSKGVPQTVVDALARSRYSMPAASNRSSGRKGKGSRSPLAEPDKCVGSWSRAFGLQRGSMCA